ncbi:hypothetical protein V2S66_05340 [Streptomyces sp. V4-01]|uniref:Uncharacterized protein n=1 Tax=Actinacidiphila polyblastidii TaxID=3110430 RepID=A0ABU7P6E8_9ACTN|nr:hypothetical protein [Streptomyces sp. V4-01]
MEEPQVYRTKTTVSGPKLDLDEDEALFGVDRLLADADIGTRLLYQTLIPFITLETLRVTHGTEDRPLILEILKMSVDRAQLAYRITPEPTRKLRAVRT